MKKILCGNWKMNGNTTLLEIYTKFKKDDFEGIESVIAVPSLFILPAISILPSFIKVAAQDCSVYNGKGAYTGEISADILKENGVEYVLIGHSERRQFCNETNYIISRKIFSCINAGIKPILCIGEPLNVRREGNIIEYLYLQLRRSIEQFNGNEIAIDIAYEPVWAIGTKETATIFQIQEVVDKINHWKKKFNLKGRILYGGSVNSTNISDLVHIKGLGGVLIGKASLSEEFSLIASNMNKIN
ncbi:Triosephosphate isomerase [Astathelohania contejeani]|uniref:Triosephosphate isomerase n=1 Tax=Astathelohania contejeani TaxID=164912 RepID=A0ABQ7HXL4_9MICR|nr:Triosephosphate isomerase [Thelohania contejeani]